MSVIGVFPGKGIYPQSFYGGMEILLQLPRVTKVRNSKYFRSALYQLVKLEIRATRSFSGMNLIVVTSFIPEPTFDFRGGKRGRSWSLSEVLKR